MKATKLDQLRAEILSLTKEYSDLAHQSNRPGLDNTQEFIPGETPIPYASRVFGPEEVQAAVRASLEFWLTLGDEGKALQTALRDFLNVRSSVLCNSGSSANLLAVSCLTSHQLKDRRLLSGDEVITVASGFPTTISPLLQYGLVPVFIDTDPVTLNAQCHLLEQAKSSRTRAVMMAHTLGNPFDLQAVTDFCQKHDLWLIEDNCDALGSLYNGQPTGSFGDLSTQSFYPPHHLTMGEGGAVNIVRLPLLRRLVESFRDWGRDCWCPSGMDNTCGKRFGWKLGELPEGYDHKYIYTHLGYNLKPLDVQAAIGNEQIKRLPDFVEARKNNWNLLRKGLDDLSEHLDFMLPTHATSWSEGTFLWDDSGSTTDVSWFGFMIRVRPTSPFHTRQLARHLDLRLIGNRMLFGGNLTRQPALIQLKQDNPSAFRIIGELAGADIVMNETIFIGVYPGLTEAMIEYMVDSIHDIVKHLAGNSGSPSL